LARPQWKAPPQSIHIQGRRPSLRRQNAQGRPSKKSPRLGDVAALADAWAEAQSGSRQAHCRRVAKELARLAGGLKPRDLNRLHWQSLVNSWRGRYAPSTTWQYTCYLRMLARSIGQIAEIPGLHRDVPRVKMPRPRTEILTPEEISALLTNADPWMRVFLTLTTALGLRHSEALDVRPAGFNPDKHTVTFLAKGGERQTMPTTEEVEALFTNAPPGHDPMTPLVEIYKGAPVNRNSTWWAWHKLKRKAGVRDNITPHDLRRTLAVTGYELTKDLRFIWQVLRHRNLSSTARYLEHVDTSQLRPLLQQLWTPKKHGEPIQ
jgi:integrase